MRGGGAPDLTQRGGGGGGHGVRDRQRLGEVRAHCRQRVHGHDGWGGGQRDGGQRNTIPSYMSSKI